MLVQTYEVQTPEEALALAWLGVDHIGVLVGDGVFPRELSVAQTNAIFVAVPAGKKRVALSLSADLEEVARVVRETRPDIIQLQAPLDDFSVAMTRALKTRFPQVLIMQAIPVINATSIETAASYQGVAHFLLLDSWDPGTGQFGALGRTHDWSLSRRIVEDVGIPAILAGGLGPENVADAIAVVRPAASIRRPRPIGRTGAARTSQRSRPSSPRQSSPFERSRPEFDGAIILNNAEQSQPAREPGRAARVIIRFCSEWRIIDDGLAGIGWMRRQGECHLSCANRLLCGGRQCPDCHRDKCSGFEPAQHRKQAHSAFSIASAPETSNWPGCSTLSALTTPFSTSIE
jgi:phosphoribosylanthranilate isomerase